MPFHDALAVLDDDDRDVDHDADRQHDREQRHRVRRVADRLEHDERADQADRHRQGRNQGGADAAEKEIDHDDDEDERLDQRLLHLVDGVGDEHRRVVGHLPLEVLGEALLQLHDLVLDRLQRGDRVGAGALVHRNSRRRPAIESGLAIEVRGAEIGPGDVAEPQHRSVRIGADDDVLELGDRGQPALGLDVELELLVVRDRPRADPADRRLDVLRLDRVDDVAGGQAEPGEPIGSNPGPHRIVLRAVERRVADAGRALDRVEHVDGDVVRQKELVVRVLGRVERDDAEQGRRLLLHRNALALNLLRQARQRNLHPIVDIDGVDVRIGAEPERDRRACSCRRRRR